MKRLLFFLLLALQLRADPKDPYTLAVTEGEPASLVEGIVSAITGDLYIAEEDAVIQGYVPLHLPRYYVSGNGRGSRAGWFFLNHLEATFKAVNSTEHTIKIQDTNGSVFSFQGSGEEVVAHYEKAVYEKKKHVSRTKFLPPASNTTLGLTNTSQGEISGHSNLKNAYIKLDPDGRHFTLYCPDGTERRYKAHHKQKNFDEVFKGDANKHLDYLLQSEKSPAGHLITYGYDSHDRLTQIRTAKADGTKTYASANFRYLHKDPSKDAGFDIFTSDGRTVSYRYERIKGDHHNNFLLRGVILPDAPMESLFYHKAEKHSGPLVGTRTIPGNRLMTFDYYREGKNDVSGTKVKIKDHHDPRWLRVKTLNAPVGTDASTHITHRLFHDPGQGTTDVFEIDNTYIRYKYSPQTLRLECIYRHDANRTLVNYERFSWTPSGDLLSRSFYDVSGAPYFTRSFEYDNYGNVKVEKIQGNLSGQSPSEIAVTRREYSQEGHNLLLREEDPSGTVTLYTYLPNTNLLTSKLICEGSQIKVRQFYEYTKDLILFREIIDDGSTSNINNFTGVHTRKIKHITPITADQFYGMPSIIEERYWDGSKEVLLKKTVLSYTAGGLIDKQDIYDANDQFRYTLLTKYDSLGRPIQETNALGQIATYGYDESGNKISSKDFSGMVTTMAYDYSNRLISTKEKGADGLERETRHSYDQKHNKIATVDHFGNATRYIYDNYGHVIRTHFPSTLDSNGNTIHPTLSFTYDSAGREISHTDPKGEITQTKYNARSQKTWVKHPDGSEEKFIYNLDGTLKTYVDREGYSTAYTYDIFGRKTSETNALGKTTSYIYDAFNLIAIIDPEGYKTTYTYDGAGRKIGEAREGEKVAYAYDALGRITRILNGDLVTITEYDLLDQKIEERREDANGCLLFKERYSYDSAGNLNCITRFVMDQEAKETKTYDSFGRLISTIDPLGYETGVKYDEAHTNSLKQRVLQKTTIDPLGLETIETYNTHHRLVSTEIKNRHQETLSLEEKYYDSNGNCCRQVSTIFPTQKMITTVWEYGPMRRLKTLIEAYGTPESKVTSYTYTKNGLLSQTIKPDGTTLERTYDRVGNLLALISSDQTISYVYQYNSLNQLVESQDRVHGTSTMRKLDPKGRILEEKQANGLTLKNSYDARGRRYELVLPDRSSITYKRDALHLREVIRKDANGFTLYTHLYKEYDLSGHLLKAELLEGLGDVTYAIDPLGRTTHLDNSYFSQQVVAHDPLGNITELKTQDILTTFTYDDLYQLTSEEGAFTHRYAYDSHQNRLQKDAQNYTHNALHQPSHLDYDKNGNPTRHSNGHLTYDALDRLISIETPATRVLFTYDSFHRRLSKTVYHFENGLWHEANHLFFLYDNLNEIGATDASGQLVQTRILGATPKAEIGATIAIELHGQLYAVISDLLGNIAALISPSGTEESYLYGAFGDRRIVPNSLHNPWQYASKRIDEETGLIFYGRRYYDPNEGRWLTPDPQGPEERFQDGMNLYAFVLNNPVNEVDLYGLSVVVSTQDPQLFALSTNPIPNKFYVPKQVAPKPINHPWISGPLDEGYIDQKAEELCNRIGVPYRKHPTIRFEWGNGVANDFKSATRSAKYISRLTGKYNFHFVHNQTRGIHNDLARFFQTRKGTHIPPNVAMIINEWYKYLHQSPDKTIVRVCHSEGVLQTKVALMFTPQEIRERIHVIAVAPAAFIPEKLCGSVVHLCSERDPIPKQFAIKDAQRAGEMHTFQILKPHRDAKGLWDHGVRSETYRGPLKEELHKHLKMNQGYHE